MKDLTESIAYKQGAKAAKLGTPIEQSELRNLKPYSERYDQFMAGYDSVLEDNEETSNQPFEDDINYHAQFGGS